MSNLALWLREHRVVGSKVDATGALRKFNELGATEVADLADLDEEDVSSFQPILKKLEYVRFQRAIGLMRHDAYSSSSSNVNVNVNATLPEESSSSSSTRKQATKVPIQDLNDLADEDAGRTNIRPVDDSSRNDAGAVVPVVSNSSSNSNISSSSMNGNFNGEFEEPPLPTICPEKTCGGIGTLTCELGKRSSKHLVSLGSGTPDFRWVVSCSQCNIKWHACHFLCGHLAKISPLVGSSDIIRHEMGRYNRWQKKIKPPCSKNPMNGILQAGYTEERRKVRDKDGMGPPKQKKQQQQKPKEGKKSRRPGMKNGKVEKKQEYQQQLVMPNIQQDSTHNAIPVQDEFIIDESMFSKSCSNSKDDSLCALMNGDACSVAMDDNNLSPSCPPPPLLTSCPLASSEPSGPSGKRHKLSDGTAATATATSVKEMSNTSQCPVTSMCNQVEKLILDEFGGDFDAAAGATHTDAGAGSGGNNMNHHDKVDCEKEAQKEVAIFREVITEHLASSGIQMQV